MVVENVDERHVKRAAWAFPAYLLLINLFAVSYTHLDVYKRQTWIGYFYILTFIIGFGAITNLIPNPADYFIDGEIAKGLKGGGNMAAVHLARAVGGDLFMGFISAVAFATILAVVAGLTLSGAAAVSHDLYASVWRDGNADPLTELRVSRCV